MSNLMKLSVITISYNDEKVIGEYLASLTESEIGKGEIKAEVLVVDNNSSDRTVEIVKNSNLDVDLTVLNQNVGFSVANNIALAKCKGDVVLFLNPDVEFSGDIFAPLLDYLESRKDVGALTCKVVLPDGKPDLNTRRNFPTPLSALKHFLHLPNSHYYITGEDDEEQEIPACGGSFLMVKREVLDKIGNWD